MTVRFYSWTYDNGSVLDVVKNKALTGHAALEIVVTREYFKQIKPNIKSWIEKYVVDKSENEKTYSLKVLPIEKRYEGRTAVVRIYFSYGVYVDGSWNHDVTNLKGRMAAVKPSYDLSGQHGSDLSVLHSDIFDPENLEKIAEYKRDKDSKDSWERKDRVVYQVKSGRLKGLEFTESTKIEFDSIFAKVRGKRSIVSKKTFEKVIYERGVFEIGYDLQPNTPEQVTEYGFVAVKPKPPFPPFTGEERRRLSEKYPGIKFITEYDIADYIEAGGSFIKGGDEYYIRFTTSKEGSLYYGTASSGSESFRGKRLLDWYKRTLNDWEEERAKLIKEINHAQAAEGTTLSDPKRLAMMAELKASFNGAKKLDDDELEDLEASLEEAGDMRDNSLKSKLFMDLSLCNTAINALKSSFNFEKSIYDSNILGEGMPPSDIISMPSIGFEGFGLDPNLIPFVKNSCLSF